MTGFDIRTQREKSLASLEFELQAGPSRALGTAATLALGEAVVGWVVGLEEQARPVAVRALRWLQESEASEESSGQPPSYFAMLRAEAIAVATWLLTDEHPGALFAAALPRHEQAIADLAAPLSHAELRAGYLPDYVRDCFSAGQAERGAAAYARHGGRPLTSLDDVQTPLELAAWLCSTDAEATSWAAAGRRVLHPHLGDWLDTGQGLRAAAWLKVVLWDSGATRTADETLRSACLLVAGDGADPLTAALTDSLGDPVDVELFGGFLAAIGAALLRHGTDLVDDPPQPGALLVADLAERDPLAVPAAAAPVAETGLDDAVSRALAEVAGPLGERRPGGRPWLTDLLDAVAGAARGHVVDTDGQTPLTVRSVLTHHEPARGHDAALDWRDQVAAVLAAGRLRLPELAPLAAQLVVPDTSVGLRDQDRRALLALRDLASARARGVPLERPAHPDPAIAAARAQLLADLEAALDGTALPGPESAAYVVHAILDPDGVRRSRSAPAEWQDWLGRI
jgi:hypothetical protein